MNVDTALSQALELSKAEPPTLRELDFLRNWLERPAMGDLFLNDVEQTTWASSNGADLITLSRHSLNTDHFTKWLSGALLNLHHWHQGGKNGVC